jgi:hypothetical protein
MKVDRVLSAIAEVLRALQFQLQSILTGNYQEK